MDQLLLKLYLPLRKLDTAGDTHGESSSPSLGNLGHVTLSIVYMYQPASFVYIFIRFTF